MVMNSTIVENLPQDKIQTFVEEVDRLSGEYFIQGLQTDDLNETDTITTQLNELYQMKQKALARIKLM